MQIKSVALSGVKAGPDDGLKEGEFLAYPATFTREPDSYGDVIAKGAFMASIAKWKASGDVMPGMYLHDPNQIVAGATDMGEDDHGWWVKGSFDDDPQAQRIYKLLKGRRLSALSFAFNIEDSGEVKLEDGRKANELRKLDSLEFSFLPKGFAANSDTSVVAVKSFTDSLTHDLKAGRVLASKHIDSLRKAQEAIGAVIAAAEAENDQEKASEALEAKPNANDEASNGKSSALVEELKASSSVDDLAAQAKIYALSSAEEGSL
ncbi:head maturation protease [Arthrobacter phage 1191A]|nr:head maturation protease [Arthrobacter phage 1191A]